MIATFMNNIQIQIERIHIRYEDSNSVPGITISGGLCLQSLIAETTNSKWKETDINGKAATIYKLVKFSKFSLYCLCGDKVEVGRQSNNNWRLAMRDILETVMQGNEAMKETAQKAQEGTVEIVAKAYSELDKRIQCRLTRCDDKATRH